MSEEFDLCVIGSGPGGYRAAILAALRGLRVAIVERGDWGGCCLNRGCVPKKDWYHSARLIAANRHLADRGIQGRLIGDMQQAWEHQEHVVATIQDSYVDYMKRLRVHTVKGHARFQDTTHIAIRSQGEQHTLSAKHTIIATGGMPRVPRPFHAVRGKVLTTDMLYDERPPDGRRVAIIGSGIVATEFAFIFRMLGKEVIWLARSTPLRKVPFSAQARSALAKAFDDNGIHLREGVAVASVDTSAKGVRLELHDGDSEEVDWVCLGTGRVPYTRGLHLEEAGIQVDDEGFIRRNEQLQTDAPNIYAIGDVAGAWMTANHALSDATIAVTNILEGNTHRQDGWAVPVVIYSALEMARLGMNEEMAEDRDLEPAVGFAAFGMNPCALGQDETAGFVRLLADMDSGRLLGGEVIGAEAGEIIHLISLAPDPKTALRMLVRGRYNHPARGEEVLNAAETLASKWGLQGEIFG